MDPLTKSSQKLPSLRTYAKDLEHTRKEKNLPADTSHTETAPAKTSKKILPQKKEPLIKVTPVQKPLAAKELTSPKLKPIPAKKPLPKLPTFQAAGNKTFIVDNEDAAAATIITDTKRDRFKLLPSLFASIKKWYADQKKARTVKNAPKYTIPETTYRKGVIQKATSTTGMSATADFASIQERIKQRKAQIKKGKTHTTWSANTEPSFLLLAANAPEPITNVQLVSRKSFRTVPVAPLQSPTPAIVPTPSSVPEEIIVTSTITPVDDVEIPESVPEPVDEQPAEETVSVQDTETKYTFLSLNTNLLALSISGIALVLVVAGTFGHEVLTKNAEITAPAVALPTALLPTSSFIRLQNTPLTRSALIAKLATLPAEGGVISEFVFTDTTGAAITPTEIISTLAISTEQNLTQSIKNIHFGYVANTEPYLLLEVTDDIVARGGLLAWEETLYADFTTIYSQKNEKLSGRIKFIDGTFGGSDVRILKNETGSEIVMYGMLDTMILITTNSRTFSELANLIQ